MRHRLAAGRAEGTIRSYRNVLSQFVRRANEAEIAYAHHEKLDGTGYPRGLSRADIPPAARALSVCDVYDALTASDRPYKKAVPRDAALGILEEEAKRDRLDPWMVSAFIEGRVWKSLAS